MELQQLRYYILNGILQILESHNLWRAKKQNKMGAIVNVSYTQIFHVHPII